MNHQAVSIIDAISSAFDRMKTLLFRGESRVETWMVLGFCAWLTGSSSSFNFNYNFSNNNGLSLSAEQCHALLPFLIGLGILGVILFFVFLFLASRFQFIWLDNLLHQRKEIRQPWREFRRHGNSYFWGILLFGALLLILLVPISLVLFFLLLQPVLTQTASGSSIVMIFLATGLPVLLVAVYLSLLLGFIPPVMYACGVGFRQALAESNRLIWSNPGTMFRYVLGEILLAIAAGTVILIGIIASCCCLGILLCLPYLGSVVTLPISTTFTYYKLELLAQLRPEWLLFPPPELKTEPTSELIEDANHESE